MKRLLLLGLIPFLASCDSDSSTDDQAVLNAGNTPAQTAFFPTPPEAKGIGADYIVMAPSSGGGEMVLVAPLSEEFVRSRAGLVPVAGAIVTYPDGSTQTSDATGRFDSSQSQYVASQVAAGQAGQQDFPDAPVVVEPPAGSNLQPLEEEVLVVPADQEATWESGSYTSEEFQGDLTDPKESNLPDGFLGRLATDIWSDNLSDYLFGGASFDYVSSVGSIYDQPRGAGYDKSVVVVEFDTTYRTWFVPYYAKVNTPGYIEYDWAADWTVRKNGLKQPIGWRWQIVTITRGRPANRVALSVWAQAWVGRYIPLTIFSHG